MYQLKNPKETVFRHPFAENLRFKAKVTFSNESNVTFFDLQCETWSSKRINKIQFSEKFPDLEYIEFLNKYSEKKEVYFLFIELLWFSK